MFKIVRFPKKLESFFSTPAKSDPLGPFSILSPPGIADNRRLGAAEYGRPLSSSGLSHGAAPQPV